MPFTRLVKPLVKWPGGKTSELDRILPLIPEHARFHEPFLGGGALFFHLEPERGHVSDVNASLIGLYRGLIGPQRQATRKALLASVAAWGAVGAIGRDCAADAVGARGSWATFDRADMHAHAQALIGARWGVFVAIGAQAPALFPADAVAGACAAALSAKLWRIRNAAVKKGVVWSDEDVYEQVETAVRAGLYTYLRDAFAPADPAAAAMRFFFLREFCYGAMFRLNAKGRFNIPYGGRSYNTKNFAGKVARVLGDDVHALLARTTITLGPFECCLTGALNREDFVFLDPPYDSEFSEYDGHAFGREQQAALAHAVAASDAKCLLVMKASPFITNLYAQVAAHSRHRMRLDTYDKLYAYNTKGRNDRAAQHLVVRNYG